LLPSLTVAQPDWEILLYDGASIHVLTEGGITQSRPLPAGAEQVSSIDPTNTSYTAIRISPDRRWLVFTRTFSRDDGTPPTAVLQLANLAENTCCITIPPPFDGRADIIIVGPFSPDGAQFAALLVRTYGVETWESRVVTIDVNTREVVAQLAPLETAALGDIGVRFGAWDDAGIKLVSTCLACEPTTEAPYLNWNPATGALTPNAGYYSFTSHTLLATGEQITAIHNPDFPYNTEPGVGGPPPNVIEYLPTGDLDAAAVIYHDSARLVPGIPHWVMDGNAYLLHPEYEPSGYSYSTATLVFRNGGRQPLEFGSSLRFITGTPNGWLMQDSAPRFYRAYYYRYHESGLSVTELDAFEGTAVLLEKPVLGATASSQVTPVNK
jgi:hypothetical protein